ncbi:hypothetical protein EXIGLDRAFT_600460 [Exidia glandulosa HHB12029]|uniref:MYND-type domain-containing protein n=1 Tax=Exidia glandulosa HHB12029 TaxID=1314781 RepID=A0A166BRQ8_EXIGL|nr:hypothetical protein EXIGLDRAFT_600460 [Exidia glandulosa HHB12029]
MSGTAKRGPCAVCNLVTTNWCSRCENRFYCSPLHLHQEWPRHRFFCRSPSTTAPLQASSSPPSSPDTPTSSFKAIYFPKLESNTYIVSVPCRSPATRGESMCPRPVVDPFLSTSGSRQPAAVVLTKNLGCERRYPLQVWYCPDSGTFNRAIWKVTSGQARRVVKGDVLVMKFAGKRRQGYIDATNLDLASLTQYFLSQG